MVELKGDSKPVRPSPGNWEINGESLNNSEQVAARYNYTRETPYEFQLMETSLSNLIHVEATYENMAQIYTSRI